MARRAVSIAEVVAEYCANAQGTARDLRCIATSDGTCWVVAGKPCHWWSEAVEPGLPEGLAIAAAGAPRPADAAATGGSRGRLRPRRRRC